MVVQFSVEKIWYMPRNELYVWLKLMSSDGSS
jgi:hypothetical protein